MKLPFRSLFAASTTLVAASSALAATTWVGNTSADWNNGLNWSSTPALPATGDSLVFGVAGTSGATLTDTMTAGASFAGITFNSGASAYTMSGNAFTLTGGGITNNGTSAQVINQAITFTGAQSLTTTTGGGDITLGGAITGTGPLVIAGTGTTTFRAPNAAYTIGGGTKTIASGATMKVDLSAQTTQFTATGIGTTVVNGALELSGTAVNASGFYIVNSLSASGAGNINVTGGGAIVINSAGALDSFTGAININGTSQLTLQGPTTSAVGNFAVNIASGATLDMRTDTMKVGTLTGSGTIIKSFTGVASVLNFGNDNGTGTYSGNITTVTNTLSLIKSGSGKQTFSGNSSYTGTMAISAGKLNAANNTAGERALGAGNVTVNGGTLAINDTSAGQVTLGAGATLAMTSGKIAIDITGASTFDKVVGNGTAHFTLTGGTLQLNGVGGFEGTGGVGNTYNLFGSFAGTGNSVSGLTISGYDTANWLASLSTGTGTLSFTAIPEPSTYGLIGAGALAAIAGVRRRRRATGVAV